MRLSHILRAFFTFTVWMLALQANAQLLGNGAQLESLEKFTAGKFQFKSVRATYWPQVVAEGKQLLERADKVWVPARLYMPRQISGKVPAMVIEHGIGGLYYRDGRIRPYVEYAELLAEAGIAALVVDTHGGRGIGATRQLESSQVSVYTFIADVFAAADMLRSHPNIDGNRIGVMGFSKGGSTTLLSVDKRFVETLSKTGTPFALHLAVYPGCQTFPENLRSTGAPVYFLLGEKDNYAGTSGCYEIERKLKTAGNFTKLITYPGAFHSWDEDSKPFRVEDVSSADCRWIPKDNGSVWGGGTTKPIESASEGKSYFRSCAKREEIYVGRVESAYQAGRRDVVDISKQVLLDAPKRIGRSELAGTWNGKLTCSASLLSKSPEYSQSLSISLADGRGSVTVDEVQTVERFDVGSGTDGVVRIDSQGSWKASPERRWQIRTQGRVEGSSLRAAGAMYAGDGKTIVRERCVIELARSN